MEAPINPNCVASFETDIDCGGHSYQRCKACGAYDYATCRIDEQRKWADGHPVVQAMPPVIHSVPPIDPIPGSSGGFLTSIPQHLLKRNLLTRLKIWLKYH